MEYRISLSLSVDDPQALWAAAAAAGLASPGMSKDEVVDTIGSGEDPEIADCLMLLLQPPRIAGVAFDDFTCRAVGKPAIVSAVRRRAAAALRGTVNAAG